MKQLSQKPLIRLLVLFCLLFVLVGCGGGGDEEADPVSVPGQPAEEEGQQGEAQQADGSANAEAQPPDNQTGTQEATSQGAGQGADQETAAAEPAAVEPARVGVGSIPLDGTVILWHSWAQTDADALNEILGRVQSENPGLTIETLFVAHADLEQSYIESVQGGGGPDLVLAPNWWIGNFVNKQVVAPVQPLITQAALDSYWPATVENLSWDSVAYGIPVNFEVVSLYYNSSLVASENLPSSTDELFSSLAADDGSGMGLYNSLYHLYWGIPAFGGELMDPSGRVILDQGFGAAEYLSWLILMDGTPDVYIDLDYGMLIDRFKKGEYAFFVDGPWSINELRQSLGDNLQVTRLPNGPGGPARPWLSADGYFVNPYVPVAQQQLSIATALELTDPQSGTIMAQIGAKLPANRLAPVADPLLREFMAQAESADPMPSRPEIYQVLGYGGDMLLKALNGVADPTETVIETAALINDATGH